MGYEIAEEEECEGRAVSGTKIALILLGVACSSAIAYLKFFTHLAMKVEQRLFLRLLISSRANRSPYLVLY